MKNWPERLSGENALLLFFIGVATYMYVGARPFPEEASQFPQLTAVVVIIGASLFLLRDYLPSFMEGLVSDEAELMDATPDDDAAEALPGEAENEPDEPDSDEVNRRVTAIPSTVFTTVTISAYVLFGYLFGLLWATPVFVVFYMWWYKQPRWQIAFVAALSMIVVYLFVVFLYAPFDEGVLLDLGWILELL